MPSVSRGFTLIESMVVIAIVGILAAVAAPALTESMARRRLESAASELTTDLQYAKSQAASINANISLVTTVRGYTISGTVNGAAVTYKTVVLHPASSLTDAVTVIFEPYQTLPTAAVPFISVTNSQTATSLRVITDTIGGI